MSIAIGNNLIAKPVVPQIREQAPAVKPNRTSPENIPATVEPTTALIEPSNNFIPNNPVVLAEPLTEANTATFVEAEGTTFGDVGDLLEWTDDVPEMKEDFVEVEVDDNARVDSIDSDDSDDEEQEDGNEEPFNGMSDKDAPAEELEEAFAA